MRRAASTSFSETVIILTSNLGSEYLDKPVMTDEMREQVMEVVRDDAAAGVPQPPRRDHHVPAALAGAAARRSWT